MNRYVIPVSILVFLLYFSISLVSAHHLPEVIITIALVTAYLILSNQGIFSSVDAQLEERGNNLGKVLSLNLEEKRRNLLLLDSKNLSLSTVLSVLPSIASSSTVEPSPESSGMGVQNILRSVYAEEKSSIHSIYSKIGVTGTAKGSSFPATARGDLFLQAVMDDLENGTR